MVLYLIRHAYSRANTPLFHPCDPRVDMYEDSDCSLTHTGIKQAKILGERMANVEVDYLLCSPYHRTVATAAYAISKMEKKPTIELLTDLVEIRSGYDDARVPTDILAEMYPGTEYKHLPHVYEKRDGSKELVYERAEAVRDYILSRFEKQDRVMIVSHRNFLKALCYVLSGFPMDKIGQIHLEIDNASTSVIEFVDEGTLVRRLNENAYLGELAGYREKKTK